MSPGHLPPLDLCIRGEFQNSFYHSIRKSCVCFPHRPNLLFTSKRGGPTKISHRVIPESATGLSPRRAATDASAARGRIFTPGHSHPAPSFRTKQAGASSSGSLCTSFRTRLRNLSSSSLAAQREPLPHGTHLCDEIALPPRPVYERDEISLPHQRRTGPPG